MTTFADLSRSSRVPLLATILGPGLLVLAVRLLAGGPASAPAGLSIAAGPGAALPGSGGPGATSLTDRQSSALKWIAEHRLATAPVTESPMQTPAVLPDAKQSDSQPAKPRSAPADTADPLDQVKVSAIMGHDDTGLVSIDGKVFRLGDEIAPGWRLSHIDGRARRIIVSRQGEPDRVLSLEP
ncbi:MAG: hypothetical protein AB7G11_04990 [Phycisphaerales bacterium]